MKLIDSYQEWQRDRPYEARQPISYDTVPIPTDVKHLEDERKANVTFNLCNSSLSAHAK